MDPGIPATPSTIADLQAVPRTLGLQLFVAKASLASALVRSWSPTAASSAGHGTTAGGIERSIGFWMGKHARRRRALQGEGDQTRNSVAAEDHRGEAACDDREKKAGCDSVLHREGPQRNDHTRPVKAALSSPADGPVMAR